MSITKRTSYNKICIMCNEPFVCFKISTMYCSKKCANRSRNIPHQLRLTLMKRNAAYTLSTDKYIAYMGNERLEHHVIHNPTPDIIHGVKGATNSNPAGEDLGLLIEYAKQKAAERGMPVVDISMKDMLLTDSDRKKKYVKLENKDEAAIDIDDTLPDPDDDGLSGPSNNHTDKIESMTLADEPCPDCGSKHHRSCDKQAKPTLDIDQQDDSKQDVNKEEQPVIRKGIRKLGSK